MFHNRQENFLQKLQRELGWDQNFNYILPWYYDEGQSRSTNPTSESQCIGMFLLSAVPKIWVEPRKLPVKICTADRKNDISQTQFTQFDPNKIVENKIRTISIINVFTSSSVLRLQTCTGAVINKWFLLSATYNHHHSYLIWKSKINLSSHYSYFPGV